MFKSFLKCLLFGSITLSAAYALDDENNLNLQRPKELNQVVGTPDSIKSFKTDTTDNLMLKKKTLKNDMDEVDSSKFKKVKLIDAVLETLAYSDLLKSSREKVIQYEIKVKDAMAEFYPTLSYEYNWGRTRAKPRSDDNFKFKYFDDQSYRFVLRQNLYAGGGSSDNLNSIIKRLDVSKNQYRIVLDEEIKKAVKAYFDVVFANRSVLVNERNMKKLQKILKIVTIKYDNGAASIGDLTSIKANVANAMTKLVRVKSKFIEALRYYEYIVGIEFKNTMPYEKNFDVAIAEFEELYKRAEGKNRDLVNYYETIEVEKYNKKRAQSEFKPKLDFELSYERTIDSEDFEEQEGELNGKVSLSYNLFNGGRDKNSVLEKNSKIRDLQYRLSEEKKKLRWNLSKLHTSINSVSDALKSTIEEIKASRIMVSSYWDAFKLGEQDLNTLLQGQRQLNTAETELVNFEKSRMSDFFNILELTGDLSSFFDVDPENPKFIDFSKSDYKKTIIAKDGEKLVLEEKLKKEEIKKTKEEIKQIPLPKSSIEENIKKFIEEFKNFDDESYMIEISSFNTTYGTFEFISQNFISEKSFYYDVINELDIQTNIAYNNFKTKEEAQKNIIELKKKDANKKYEPKKVKDIKALYENYIKGLKLKPQEEKVKIKTKVKLIEKVRQEIKEEEFITNEEFKKEFLNSNSAKFTINVSTFASNNEIKNFVLENEIYEKSFFFKYGDNQLFKLVNGIYDNYNQALEEISVLRLKNNNIFPVVQRIELIKKQYLENIEINEKEKKVPEYEYINLSKKEEKNYPLKTKNKLEKAKKEELRLKKLEEERIAKQKAELEVKRLAEEKKLAEEKRLAQEKAKRRAIAKEQALKLEQERLKAEAKRRAFAQEQARKLEQERLKAEAKRRAFAQEQARKLKEELAKKEALKKAKMQKERLRLKKLKEQKLEKEKAQALKKAELEAKKLAQEKVKKEELRLKKLEEEKLAKEKAELEAEKLKIRKIAQEQALKLEKQNLEKEEKRKAFAKEQARKLKEAKEKKEKEIRKISKEQAFNLKNKIKQEEKEVKLKNIYEKGSSIQEVDFAQDAKAKKRVKIPYKQRLKIFKENFYKVSKGKYTLKLTSIDSNKVRWYAHRFGLDPNYIVLDRKTGKSDIYYGIFDSVIEAKNKTQTLHPLIYESKPLVKKIGSVR